MTDMAKVTVNWTGFVGGPGYTNIYFRPTTGSVVTQGVADASAAKVHAFLTAWLPAIHTSVTVTVNPSVEAISDFTGNLVDFFTSAPGAGRIGTGTGTFSASQGACVNWYTAGIRNNRRVRGRSFMVPLTSNGFDNTGTLDDAKLATWRTAAATMISTSDAAKLAVWARPTAPAATDGESFNVVTSTVNDKGAILTSRRD